MHEAVMGAGPRADLLFLVGGDRPDRVVRIGNKTGYRGSTDVAKLLGNRPHHRLTLTRNMLRQARRPDLSHYRCILNLIAEPEENEKSLTAMRKLLRTAPGRVLNPPDKVLATTRDQIARRLSGIDGLVAPRVIRLAPGDAARRLRFIEASGLSWPLIVRPLATHGGKVLGRFDNGDDLAAAMDPATPYLAIEYVDFRSEDGLYRKHRIFLFGSTMILRHRLISDDWNVHARDRERVMADRPDLIAEERALLDDPTRPFDASTRHVIETIRKRIGLDFFGIDFGFDRESRMVLFEANAAMSILPFSDDPRFDYLKRCLAPAQQAFRALVDGATADAEPQASPD